MSQITGVTCDRIGILLARHCTG